MITAIFYFFIFFIPGFAFFILLRDKLTLQKKDIFVTSILFLLLSVTVCFCFFLNDQYGYIFSYLTLIFSLVIIFVNLNFHSKIFKFLKRDFLLLFSVYFLYTSITDFIPININDRFLPGLPTDNYLPLNFAECTYYSNDSIKECFQRGGFWQSSDRPPILSSVILFLLPFKVGIYKLNEFYNYIGVLIQSTWVNALLFF